MFSCYETNPEKIRDLLMEAPCIDPVLSGALISLSGIVNQQQGQIEEMRKAINLLNNS